MKRKRQIFLSKDFAVVPLTKGKIAIIDHEDVGRVGRYNWRIHDQGYAIANVRKADGKWTTLKMHRLINETPDGLETDHINGDKLDNRRGNLRSCTKSENQKNAGSRGNSTSKYVGVSWYKQREKWRALIEDSGKNHFLGYFEIEEEAARAYDKAAVVLHGDFAKINFPEKGDSK